MTPNTNHQGSGTFFVATNREPAFSPRELLHSISMAFELALSGRPGPVIIDVAKDVQTATISFAKWPEPDCRCRPERADVALIQAAAEMINGAKRPILCLGGGIIHGDASAEARALIDRASLPTAMTLMGLGALPAGHPLALGMLGMHAARSTNLALQEWDVFFATGARFDDRTTGKIVDFCPAATVIHMDIDPTEVSKLKSAYIGLVGDFRETLSSLLLFTSGGLGTMGFGLPTAIGASLAGPTTWREFLHFGRIRCDQPHVAASERGSITGTGDQTGAKTPRRSGGAPRFRTPCFRRAR